MLVSNAQLASTRMFSKKSAAIIFLDLDIENLPPSAPERTLQASGQGQFIARPKGGPPCCSVPVPSTRWAASGATPPLNTSCVCLCQEKLTHANVRTCATQ